MGKLRHRAGKEFTRHPHAQQSPPWPSALPGATLGREDTPQGGGWSLPRGQGGPKSPSLHRGVCPNALSCLEPPGTPLGWEAPRNQGGKDRRGPGLWRGQEPRCHRTLFTFSRPGCPLPLGPVPSWTAATASCPGGHRRASEAQVPAAGKGCEVPSCPPWPSGGLHGGTMMLGLSGQA